jgi:hypothetical protein
MEAIYQTLYIHTYKYTYRAKNYFPRAKTIISQAILVGFLGKQKHEQLLFPQLLLLSKKINFIT